MRDRNTGVWIQVEAAVRHGTAGQGAQLFVWLPDDNPSARARMWSVVGQGVEVTPAWTASWRGHLFVQSDRPLDALVGRPAYGTLLGPDGHLLELHGSWQEAREFQTVFELRRSQGWQHPSTMTRYSPMWSWFEPPEPRDLGAMSPLPALAQLGLSGAGLAWLALGGVASMGLVVDAGTPLAILGVTAAAGLTNHIRLARRRRRLDEEFGRHGDGAAATCRPVLEVVASRAVGPFRLHLTALDGTRLWTRSTWWPDRAMQEVDVRATGELRAESQVRIWLPDGRFLDPLVPLSRE